MSTTANVVDSKNKASPQLAPGSSLVQIIERQECRLPVGPGSELLIDTRIKGLALGSAKQQDQGCSKRETYTMTKAQKLVGEQRMHASLLRGNSESRMKVTG